MMETMGCATNLLNVERNVYKLDPETELRLEVANDDDNKTAHFEITNGTAEVFGAELTTNKCYKLQPGAKLAIFTWNGCDINTYGRFSYEKQIQNNNMVKYISIHDELVQMRRKKNSEGSKVSKVMITGPVDVGKSTLCKILINYALRSNSNPIFIDLDVGQNDLSVPGTIGASTISRTVDIETGYTHDHPFVLHFGHTSPGHDTVLYSNLINILSVHTDKISKEGHESSVIINTGGWVSGEGYRLLLDTACAFEVDVLIVIGRSVLYNSFVQNLPSFVNVIYLDKSDGVIERNQKMRWDKRNTMVHEYFYGKEQNLLPHTIEVEFEDVKIYRFEKYRPGNIPIHTYPYRSMRHHVASIAPVDFDESTSSPPPVVSHFVLILEVDIIKKSMKFLSKEPQLSNGSCLIFMDGVIFEPTAQKI